MDILNALLETGNQLFSQWKDENLFIGRPFYLDFNSANILTCDSWKNKVWWISQGSFLLAFYENENDETEEALLLRVLQPSKLPTESEVISSMVEYYKDNQKTSWKESVLDPFTKFEFSCSWLECRVLWTFYKSDWKVKFGSDNENFYSANNYKVYKLKWQLLEYVVNLPDKPNKAHDNSDVEKIGVVRYSSSKRFYEQETEHSKVYIKPLDILWRRTALFGMTRTGKSNTVKKTIQIIKNMSDKWNKIIDKDNKPIWNIWQIIFDVNWEYWNTNEQDGTSIYEIYKDDVVRYSVLEKSDFEVMKVNFYNDIEAWFALIDKFLRFNTTNLGDYIENFLSIDFTEPEQNDFSWQTRYKRMLALYKCLLHRAWFSWWDSKIYFDLNKEIIEWLELKKNPKNGVTLDEAIRVWEQIEENYAKLEFFKKYPDTHDWKEWLDKWCQWILKLLCPTSGRSWYTKLSKIIKYHTSSKTDSYENNVIKSLKEWKIVIIDLSQGDEEVQKMYSERLTEKIFYNNMLNFTSWKSNTYIQFYFEEAHNLFPQKENKDLTQIYNRIAKEWAKYKLWLVYATQEVSSISSNILKNTENWFISHLNNQDEIKELKKYYDFDDFANSLIRFSVQEDKWFARIKMLSNSFVIPVQIDKFEKI